MVYENKINNNFQNKRLVAYSFLAAYIHRVTCKHRFYGINKSSDEVEEVETFNSVLGDWIDWFDVWNLIR